MVSATVQATEAVVRAVLDTVEDPEMPPVSITELGMLVDVQVDGPTVAVELVPTYSGCPALAVIRDSVEAAVRAVAGVEAVTVTFTNDVVWTPERITEAGRTKLKAFGIAPPGSGQTLLQIGRRSTAVTCPWCGSHDTVADSNFGPTPCRSSSYCNSCRNPFEVVKP